MLPFISRSILRAAPWACFALSGAVAAEVGCTPTRRTLVAVDGSSSSSTTTSVSSSSSSSGPGGSTASSSSTGGSDAGMGTGGTGGGSSDAGADAPSCSDSCGDPACISRGYTCAPDPPADGGWLGPGYLYNAAGTPPGCGAGWMPKTKLGGASITSTPVTCTACTCGTIAGDTCSTVTVELSHDPTCALVASTTTSAPNACTAGPVGVGTTAYIKGTIAASGGSCPPVGGAVMTQTPPSFGAELATCTTPTTTPAGCTSGSTCLPTAPAGYQNGVCIYQSGNVACPPGYANKTLAYQSFDDTRACLPCTCVNPSGGSCPGTLLYFEGQQIGCTGADVQLPMGTCVEVGAPTKSEVFYVGEQTGAPSGGGCANDGGAPTGTVTGATPTTICCQ